MVGGAFCHSVSYAPILQIGVRNLALQTPQVAAHWNLEWVSLETPCKCIAFDTGIRLTGQRNQTIPIPCGLPSELNQGTMRLSLIVSFTIAYTYLSRDG
jgi:hypothetical protein